MFPSLVNCCTIDWFMKWPEEALQSVAIDSLQNYGSPEFVNDLATICVTMHKVYNSVTRTAQFNHCFFRGLF